MSVPGSNLLSQAMRVLGNQTMSYTPYASRTLNAVGVYVTTYGTAQAVVGQLQPVPRALYIQYGLDFQKNYVNIFVQKNVTDIARDVAGDKFTYNGKIYEALSKTDWFAQDSWDQILCVQVPT